MNPAIVKTEQLTKVYALEGEPIPALKGVSFAIQPGEYVAIMGPSGSGKSTLMNVLGCLDTPTQGKYFLRGADVSTLSDDELAAVRNKEIGFVFQTFNLLSRADALHTVELPIIYAGKPKSFRRERAREMLDLVGLGERTHHRPNELSGGQRQRVAIARALVNKPSLVLADEPTGNLDSKTGVEIMALLDEVHRNGNTVVLVTHEEDIAANAERIVRLRDGKIESDQLTSRATSPASRRAAAAPPPTP